MIQCDALLSLGCPKKLLSFTFFKVLATILYTAKGHEISVFHRLREFYAENKCQKLSKSNLLNQQQKVESCRSQKHHNKIHYYLDLHKSQHCEGYGQYRVAGLNFFDANSAVQDHKTFLVPGMKTRMHKNLKAINKIVCTKKVLNRTNEQCVTDQRTDGLID